MTDHPPPPYQTTYPHAVTADSATAMLRRFDNGECTCTDPNLRCGPCRLAGKTLFWRARFAYLTSADHHREAPDELGAIANDYADRVATTERTGEDYPTGFALMQTAQAAWHAELAAIDAANPPQLFADIDQPGSGS